jgi:hypothetical protein
MRRASFAQPSLLRIAALGIVLGLSSCGAKNGLDKGTAASLILNAEWAACGQGESPLMQVLTLEGPPHYTRNTAALALWWIGNLERNPKVKVISKGQGQFYYGTQEYLTYTDGDHAMFVDAFTENDNIRIQAIIKLCAYEPASVEVLDTTFDANGKLAHVTYRLQSQLSPLGQQLSGGGIGSFPAPQQSEYRAVLRRLDETGWRFEARE